MSQRLILNQIAKYIELQNPTPSPELQRLIQRLKEQGFCYGFSVAWTMMARMNERFRWMEMLKLIAAWDGTASTLQQIVPLRSAFIPAGIYLTLEQVFEYVASAVIPAHGFGFDFTYSADLGITQNKVLLPKTTLMESLNAAGEIEKHQSLTRVSGSFTHTKLMQLLREAKKVKNKQILIVNRNHCIAVDCLGDSWLVYDPNYPILTEPMKNFGTLREAVSEVFSIMGHDLFLEFTALAPKAFDFKSYRAWFNDPQCIASLLRGNGLRRLCWLDSDDYLQKIVKYLQQPGNCELYEAVFRGLSHTELNVLQEPLSGFITWVMKAPNVFKKYYKIIEADPRTDELLTVQLIRSYQGGKTGLSLLASADLELMQMFVTRLVSRYLLGVINILAQYARNLSAEQQQAFLEAFSVGIKNYTYEQLMEIRPVLARFLNLPIETELSFFQSVQISGKKYDELDFNSKIMLKISTRLRYGVHQQALALVQQPIGGKGFTDQQLALVLQRCQNHNMCFINILSIAKLTVESKNLIIERVAEHYLSFINDTNLNMGDRLLYMMRIPPGSQCFVRIQEEMNSIKSFMKQAFMQVPTILVKFKFFSELALPGVKLIQDLIAQMNKPGSNVLQLYFKINLEVISYGSDPVYSHNRLFKAIQRCCDTVTKTGVKLLNDYADQRDEVLKEGCLVTASYAASA